MCNENGYYNRKKAGAAFLQPLLISCSGLLFQHWEIFYPIAESVNRLVYCLFKSVKISRVKFVEIINKFAGVFW